MKIYLGSDHNGYHLKEKVFAYLVKRGYETEDIGGFELNPSDDFPQFAHLAVMKMMGHAGKEPRSILLCGSGQGMAIAANRFKGIRACVVRDADEARTSRNDFDSNVLCLPAAVLEKQDIAVWQDILDTWLDTKFANAARFRRRNMEIDEL